jgi:hypothetical protein
MWQELCVCMDVWGLFRLVHNSNAMKKYKLPEELEAARISVLTPLSTRENTGSEFGFIVVDNKIMLARGQYHLVMYIIIQVRHSSSPVVVSIFSKTGGKNGKHAWILSALNITMVSYIPVQVFEHMHNCQFCAVHCAFQHLQTAHFHLLPGTSFLCTLKKALCTVHANLEVSTSDYDHFIKLCGHTQNIVSTLKALNGRKKTEVDEDNE